MSQKKKVTLAAVIGAAVFAAVFAVAASLNIDSDTLGAGSDDVAACSTDDVTTSYTTDWSTTAEEFVVESVDVVAPSPACNGLDFSVHVEGETADGTLDGSGEGTATFTNPVSAEDADKIHVVISG